MPLNREAASLPGIMGAETHLSLTTRNFAIRPAFRFVGLDHVGDGGELAFFLGSFEATL